MRLLLAIFSLFSLATANFGGFFEHMFGGGGGSGGHNHQQNINPNPSDASLYHRYYDQSVCERYLCPDTIACVHFPHHCPCPWDAVEYKVELAEGKRICITKGGFKEGEAARKVELARKGLL